MFKENTKYRRLKGSESVQGSGMKSTLWTDHSIQDGKFIMKKK